MAKEIANAAESKQVREPSCELREPSCELTDDELKQISGGAPTIEVVSWSWSGTNASTH
jgi:bacteriocin-like protein